MVGTRRGERSGSGPPASHVPLSTQSQRPAGSRHTKTPRAMATPNNVLDFALPDSGEPTRVGKKRSRVSRGDTGSAEPRTRRALAPSPPPGVAITDLTKVGNGLPNFGAWGPFV